jgi:hypothetical protein
MLDRHPVHRSKTISKWVRANKDKIEIFFLPPYSPALNPDEYLNGCILFLLKPANILEQLTEFAIKIA